MVGQTSPTARLDNNSDNLQRGEAAVTRCEDISGSASTEKSLPSNLGPAEIVATRCSGQAGSGDRSSEAVICSQNEELQQQQQQPDTAAENNNNYLHRYSPGRGQITH